MQQGRADPDDDGDDEDRAEEGEDRPDERGEIRLGSRFAGGDGVHELKDGRDDDRGHAEKGNEAEEDAKSHPAPGGRAIAAPDRGDGGIASQELGYVKQMS